LHHLPSFPTRRSSDLSKLGPPTQLLAVASLGCRFLLFPLGLERALALREVDVVAGGIDKWIRLACLHACVLGFHAVVVPVRAFRSEEHTSELQSRFDL